MIPIDVQSIAAPAFCWGCRVFRGGDTVQATAGAGWIARRGAGLGDGLGAGGVEFSKSPAMADGFQTNAAQDKWFLAGRGRVAAGFCAFPSLSAPVPLIPREKGAAGVILMGGGVESRHAKAPFVKGLDKSLPNSSASNIGLADGRGSRSSDRPAHLNLLGHRVGIAAVETQTLVSLTPRAVTAKKAAPQLLLKGIP